MNGSIRKSASWDLRIFASLGPQSGAHGSGAIEGSLHRCILVSLHLCIFASLTQIFQSKGSCIVVSPLYHRCIVASPRNDTPLFAQQAKKDLDQLSFSLRTKFGNSDKLRVKYVLHNQKLKLRIRLGDGEDSTSWLSPEDSKCDRFLDKMSFFVVQILSMA